MPSYVGLVSTTGMTLSNSTDYDLQPQTVFVVSNLTNLSLR